MLFSLTLSLVVAVILIQVAVFSTTIYLHRTATHRALILHPAVAFAFRFALWITTGLSTKEWVAVHRKHHAFTDEEGDPHSPKMMGFWSVQLGNVFHYVKEAKNPEVVERYARDIKEDWWDRTFFNHGLYGLVGGTVALCFVLGLGWGLLAAGVHAVMYVFVLSSSINGLCHAVGTRTSTTRRPIYASSRCSPAAKGSTTIITATRGARSSVSAQARSIPLGR